MHCKQHNKRDDLKVWLSTEETDKLLEAAESTEKRIAFALGAKCGLRSHEVLSVSPTDMVESDSGWMLKVAHGKGDKYREVPLPPTLKTQIQTADDMRDADSSQSIVSVSTTQSLRNWIKSVRETLADDTGDDRWNKVSFHDLRRTWATQLASKDVDPLIVCEWGGWNDLDTFLDHYRGTYSPEAQKRERKNIDWL
jgi:integrase